MAIGRTFKEALQKGIRTMEVKRFGFGLDKYDKWLNAQHGQGSSGTGSSPQRQDHARRIARSRMADPRREAAPKARRASQGRLYYIRYAMKMGWTIDQIHELTKIDRWFWRR